MGDDVHAGSAAMNLRAAFDVWPRGRSLPGDADEVVKGAFDLVLADVVRGSCASITFVRYATDGVSLWLADAVVGVSVEDLIRSIAVAFEPAAYAMVAVQPMRAPGDDTVRGVHCRGAFGDALIEVTGDILGADGPVAGREIRDWRVRRGTVTSDKGRWIGVLPSVKIELPLLGAGEA